MEWFEDWFNTPYYHTLYANRNEAEAAFFIENLLQKIELKASARCWDLNCGKGRYAIFLHDKGYRVIGTDLSEESILSAQKTEASGLSFYTHDMRGLFYANYFDAVFNLFTSFGYFKNRHDDELVFQSVYNSLRPGGLFVLDFFNADFVIKNLVQKDEKKIKDICFQIHKRIEHKIIIKEITAIDQTGRHIFKEEVKALDLKDFQSLAEKTGFTIKNTFGNYKLQAYDEENSERLILIFEK